jgi:hypothetical protein
LAYSIENRLEEGKNGSRKTSQKSIAMIQVTDGRLFKQNRNSGDSKKVV